MILRVNPNRMEMQRLRKRLLLARRGHKLLKDKQEELLRQFMTLVREVRERRQDVETRLMEVYRGFQRARQSCPEFALEEALSTALVTPEITVTQTRAMDIRLPNIQLEELEFKPTYRPTETTGDLDLSLKALHDVLPELLKMAETEKKVELMSQELERTRRRVNALEHILIPSLEETIKFISSKLAELERSNLTRLMKIKDIVRSH